MNLSIKAIATSFVRRKWSEIKTADFQEFWNQTAAVNTFTCYFNVLIVLCLASVEKYSAKSIWRPSILCIHISKLLGSS